MPDIKRIEKTFTYNLPDEYLHQTDSLKKTAEWTYTGPDKLWIFVNKETGKITSRFHYTERDNGAEVPTPEEFIKVLVDVEKDPIIASLIHSEQIYGEMEHTVEVLPDGSTYGVPIPVPPDHTYELTDIEYDSVAGKFKKPYPWKKPHMDWESLTNVRNGMLKSSDSSYNTASAEMKPKWEEYRQKLRDLPKTFEGVDPWKVPFPPEPKE